MSAARSGDRAALEGLHHRYAPMVHGIMLARLGPTDAEDMVQETFVQAIRKLGTVRDDAAFPAWLASVARNVANAFLRGRRGVVPLPDGLIGVGPAPGARAEAEEVLGAIQSLPDAYRETLVLRLVEGLTGPEIAARTGMTPGSVRVNLHRGMAMLRTRLGLKEGP